MKKFVVVWVAIMLMTVDCYAMTFSQPVEIGGIFWTPSSGIIFKNESYNDGKITGQWREENRSVYTYRNGIARWLGRLRNRNLFYL